MLFDRSGNEARPGQHSECPSCRGKLIAKCGAIVTWHWAHVASDCDPWSEPESQWHIQWKRDLQRIGASIEVVMGRHRADAVLPDGTVVELQSTYLSADDIDARERFYGPRLIWIYRAHWVDRLHYGARGFWWKHGAKSMARHRFPQLWHSPDDVVREVSINLVHGEYANRVLGKVKMKTDKARCLELLRRSHCLALCEGEANGRG